MSRVSLSFSLLPPLLISIVLLWRENQTLKYFSQWAFLHICTYISFLCCCWYVTETILFLFFFFPIWVRWWGDYYREIAECLSNLLPAERCGGEGTQRAKERASVLWSKRSAIYLIRNDSHVLCAYVVPTYILFIWYTSAAARRKKIFSSLLRRGETRPTFW